MSNPNLELYAFSEAQLSDAGEFLSLDFSKAQPAGCVGRFKADSQIGAIIVYYRKSTTINFGQYANPWNLMLQFDSGYLWDDVKHVLVLRLYEWLVERHPGTYLAMYDTGAVLFFSKGGRLVINEKFRDKMSRLGLPSQPYSSEALLL